MSPHKETIMEGTNMKRVHRDFASLVQNLMGTFDGQVILPEDALDVENMELKFTIRPNDGIYKDCEVEFIVNWIDYPNNSPTVLPMSTFIHPNIECEDIETGVCLNILDEWHEYDAEYCSFELIIQGVLFLFYEPNMFDALVPYAAFSNEDELIEAVNKTKYGTEIKSTYERDELWEYINFSNIYRGSDPKPIAVVCETEDDEGPEGSANCNTTANAHSENMDDSTPGVNAWIDTPKEDDSEPEEVDQLDRLGDKELNAELLESFINHKLVEHIKQHNLTAF